MTTQQPISSLYVLKAIAALWVVLLHAPLGEATEYVRWMAGASVPVFFAITGYFLYDAERNKMLAHLVSTIKKVIPMILILHLIYYSVSPISGSFGEQYMLYIKWLVWGMPPVGGHLWYLSALVQACIILWVWVKLFGGRGLWLFLLLWLARAAMEEYRLLLFGSEPSILSANVVLYALPCIALGMLLRKHEAHIALPGGGGGYASQLLRSHMPSNSSYRSGLIPSITSPSTVR